MKIYKKNNLFGVKENETILLPATITDKNLILIEDNFINIIDPQNPELFYVDNNMKLNSISKKAFYINQGRNEIIGNNHVWIFKELNNAKKGICIVETNTGALNIIEFDKIIEVFENSYIRKINDIVLFESNNEFIYFNLNENSIKGKTNIINDITHLYNVNYLLYKSSLGDYNNYIEKFAFLKDFFIIEQDNDKINIVYKSKILFDEFIELAGIRNLITDNVFPILIRNENGRGVYDLANQKFLIEFCKQEIQLYAFIKTIKNKITTLYDDAFNILLSADEIIHDTIYYSDLIYDSTNFFICYKNKKSYLYEGIKQIKENQVLVEFDFKIKSGFRYNNFFIFFTDKGFKFYTKNFVEILADIEVNDLLLFNKQFMIIQNANKEMLVYKSEETNFVLTNENFLNFKEGCFCPHENEVMNKNLKQLLNKFLLSKEQLINFYRCIISSRELTTFKNLIYKTQIYSEKELSNILLKSGYSFSIDSSNIYKDWHNIFEKLNKNKIKDYLTEENKFYLPHFKIWNN